LVAARQRSLDGGDRVVTPQIVAMGGVGFSLEPGDLPLHRYVLSLARRDRPAVLLIPTASGDSDTYVNGFYSTYGSLECRTSVLPLFKATPADLHSLLLAQDVIYVGGGNTRSMVALWREWGIDRILREAWLAGVVLAGVSAGMICWFEQGVTDSVLGSTGDPLDNLSALTCLGFLPGSACPHYDGETNRRPVYRRLVAAGELGDGYAADDGVGLHFAGGELVRVVSARPGAKAYRVERHGDSALETPITPDDL
jgi:dipeptidase E